MWFAVPDGREAEAGGGPARVSSGSSSDSLVKALLMAAGMFRGSMPCFMEGTTIIGIDCATDDERVGIALAHVRAGRCEVSHAGVGSSERQVVNEVAAWLADADRALLAMDAPLGWPRTMARALAVHRAGDGLAVAANHLFRRVTDRFIRERLGKQSLDVGADRVARTALAALNLLTDLRHRTGLPIPLAWSADHGERVAAIEIYPAATLIIHGISPRGYKKKEQMDGRKTIIQRLEPIIGLPADRTAMEANADAMDAAVCVLAGYDFLRGRLLRA